MTVIIYTCTQCRIDIEPISLIIVYDIVREWTCNMDFYIIVKKYKRAFCPWAVMQDTPNKF